MANTNNLLSSSIYIDCMQLLSVTNELICGFPNWQKDCLGSRLFGTLTDVISLYSDAYQDRKCRLQKLESCIQLFGRYVVFIRCGIEIKLINEKMMARLFLLIYKVKTGLDKYRGFSQKCEQINDSSNYGVGNAPQKCGVFFVISIALLLQFVVQ